MYFYFIIVDETSSNPDSTKRSLSGDLTLDRNRPHANSISEEQGPLFNFFHSQRSVNICYSDLNIKIAS